MNRDYGANVATNSNTSNPPSPVSDMAADTHEDLEWSGSKW